MKLYTEEQVRMAIMVLCELNSLKENVIMDSLTPIELPSAKDIANRAEILFTLEEQESFIDGAKWMKEQILNQKI
jgi:hypothetical protein